MEALFPFLLIAGIIAFFVFIIWLSKVTHESRVRDLRLFQARYLDGGLLRADEGWFASLSDAILTGRFRGRKVKISYRTQGSGKHKKYFTVFRMDIPNSVPAFRVEEAGVLNRIGRFLGIVDDVPTGNEAVDDKYIVAGKRGSLRELFRSRSMVSAIDRLFAGPGLWLELRGGRLEMEVQGFISDSGGLLGALEGMEGVAQECERKKVKVRILGEKLKFAITAGTDHAVCPFCRDAVALDADDVMACDGCNTVHHAECYSEARGCTIYGCARQRVRA